MTLEAQFLHTQRRHNSKPVRGATKNPEATTVLPSCDQNAVGRLFIPLPVAEPKSKLPDRWNFHEDLSNCTPMSNFERMQAYLVKRNNLEQAS